MPQREISTVARLRGLLNVTRLVRTADDLTGVLQSIAATVSESLGFATVVINLHRPAWDDFEVAVVHGSEAASEALLGATMRWDAWGPLLDPRFERHGAYFLPNEEFDWPADGVPTFIPDGDPGAHPDAWHPQDALFVPMHGSDGAIRGIISVDEPVSGLRPTDEDLEVLAAVAGHAALAAEHAQEAVTSARHQAALDHLLDVSSRLTARLSVDEILGSVCQAISEALGFQKVAVCLHGEGDRLVVGATAGFDDADSPDLARLDVSALLPLFAGESLRDGCVLLEAEEAERIVGPSQVVYSSVMNGRGPHAWNGHWLLVPLQRHGEPFVGFIWADDPEDRLVPTPERLRALRVFANQAISALDSAAQLESQRYLAEHDPLTGLRNRRGLPAQIDAEIERHRTVSLLVCDLDHFKAVNDALGHDAGDRALRRFAGLLAAHTRPQDVAVRLGGEEFALVLPGTDVHAAYAVAERLRREVAALQPSTHPLTVSIGIATSGLHGDRAEGLLRAADRAVRAAKRLGRDRSLIYNPKTIDEILAAGLGGPRAAEGLTAAIMLAETLDMRDDATARHSHTVGRYAELIARELGWPAERVDRMRVAGILHDVGKIGVPDAVLHKTGPLDPDEWEEIKRHSELGARILANANLDDISGWVLAHHERVDATGYPNQLRGAQIPVEARILAVADAYEAMTADRPYRRALSATEAQAELQRCAGSHFDERVVSVFLTAVAGAGERSAAA